MAYVRRANVVLEVPEDDVERYLDKGYTHIDEKGNVLEKAIPKTFDALLEAYNELKDKYDKLVDEMKVFKEVAKRTEAEAEEKPVKSGRKKANE